MHKMQKTDVVPSTSLNQLNAFALVIKYLCRLLVSNRLDVKAAVFIGGTHSHTIPIDLLYT
jgi:hypothetical protein